MCTQSCVLLCSCPPGPTVDRLMAMEPRADLLLRWNPGQTDWGHNETCGNPMNTREPSGDRLMHGNPSKTGEKTGTQGWPRGNPGCAKYELAYPDFGVGHWRLPLYQGGCLSTNFFLEREDRIVPTTPSSVRIVSTRIRKFIFCVA